MSVYNKGFLKVVVIGDSAVGKTSLLEWLNYGKISTKAKPTIGADFVKKRMTLSDQTTQVTLQLWDTAGQERYQSLCTSFYRGADCCVLVYDSTQQDTAANMDMWKKTFEHHVKSSTGEEKMPFFIIGNKSDETPEVSLEEIHKQWVLKGRAANVMKTSAMTGEGVMEAFQEVAQLAYNYQQKLRSTGELSIRASFAGNTRELRDSTHKSSTLELSKQKQRGNSKNREAGIGNKCKC